MHHSYHLVAKIQTALLTHDWALSKYNLFWQLKGLGSIINGTNYQLWSLKRNGHFDHGQFIHATLAIYHYKLVGMKRPVFLALESSNLSSPRTKLTQFYALLSPGGRASV